MIQDPFTYTKLKEHLHQLVEIAQRRRPGQVTHKIAEIEVLVELLEAETYLRGLNEAEPARADAIDKTKERIERLRSVI